MIAQVDAAGGERCATFAHAFVHADVVAILAVFREHVAHVGIVGVLSFADGSQGLDVQPVGYLEVHAQFHAVVLLVDARERDVGE